MSDPSRATVQGKDQQIVAGIQQELQAIPTMYLGSRTFTPATLAAYIQRRIDLASDVLTTRAAWQNAVATYEATNAETNVVIADLRNFLIGAFGRDSVKLAAFGLVAPKRPVLTPEQRAAAALKARATRKARKTMGKKQKAKVVGESPLPIAPSVTS
jgi:hypothetical protein